VQIFDSLKLLINSIAHEIAYGIHAKNKFIAMKKYILSPSTLLLSRYKVKAKADNNKNMTIRFASSLAFIFIIRPPCFLILNRKTTLRH